MDDPPAFGHFAQQESEQARRLVLLAVQLPVSKGQGGVGRQCCDFEIRERQRSHGGPVPVFPAIPIVNGLPTQRNVAAGGKARAIRFAVRFHEARQIAGIPFADLLLEHAADLGFQAARIGTGRAAATQQQRENRERQRRQGRKRFHKRVGSKHCL